MFVEAARQVICLSFTSVELVLHPKKDNLGNLKGVFVLKNDGKESVPIRISMVQNFTHIKFVVVC